MIGHVEAIKAALVAAGLTTYYATVPPSPSLPYVLLWSSAGLPPVEDAVAPMGDFEDTVGVTAVAGNGTAALHVQARARAALAAFRPSTAVAGRLVWLRQYDSRPVSVDQDVTLTNGVHPTTSVDMYRLVSTPA